MRQWYRCTLESDVLLQESSATETAIRALDYIPASQFRGIVAKKYDDFTDPFLVFHSGDVRFSNAYPEISGNRGLPIPLSWMLAKDGPPWKKTVSDCVQIDPTSVYNATLLDPTDDSMQYKEIRRGFMDPENFGLSTVSTSVAVKSARNPEQDRSAIGQMFTYEALAQGSAFIFFVDIPDSETEISGQINACIVGSHFIGRSKTAQYGLISIETIDAVSTIASKNTLYQNGRNMLVLYSESDLAFIDEFGRPTASPQPQDFLLDASMVEPIVDLTRVRTRTYSPWNGKRRSRDAERFCVQKGSVFVFRIKSSDFNLSSYIESIEPGVGCYIPEGFGRILANPAFVVDFDTDLHPVPASSTTVLRVPVFSDQALMQCDTRLVSFLEKELTRKVSFMAVHDEARRFIETNKKIFQPGISPSQWGAVREYSMSSRDKSTLMNGLFDETTGFFFKGVSAKPWAERKRRDVLEAYIVAMNPSIDPRHFLLILSSEMAKD